MVLTLHIAIPSDDDVTPSPTRSSPATAPMPVVMKSTTSTTTTESIRPSGVRFHKQAFFTKRKGIHFEQQQQEVKISDEGEDLFSVERKHDELVNISEPIPEIYAIDGILEAPPMSPEEDFSLVENILCQCLRDAPAAKELELLKAATIGRLDVIKRLIEVEGVDPDAFTLLSDHIHNSGCADDDSDRAEAKRKMHPGPGWPALCAAACKGHTAIVSYLLKKGATPDIMTVKDETRSFVQYFPLYLACGKGYKDIVRLLLQHRNRYDMNLTQQQGYNVVIGACMMGNPDAEILRMVVHAGANVNHLDPKGGSAMFLCAQHGRPDFMKILFEYGADPAPKPPVGHVDMRVRNSEPIHIATSRNNIEAVEILLQHGANPDARILTSNSTSLILAACNGFGEIVKLLIKYGADVNAQDCDGKTALHKSCERRYEENIETLLGNGAEIGLKDKRDETALDYAVKFCLSGVVDVMLHRNPELATPSLIESLINIGVTGFHDRHLLLQTLRVLLNNKISLDSRFTKGPLQTLCEYSDLEFSKLVCEFLLDNGAIVNYMDGYGNMPIHSAVRYVRLDLMELFLERGADPFVKDNQGNNLFHLCTEVEDENEMFGLKDLISRLVELGVDSNATNDDGITPLLDAMVAGNAFLVRMLVALPQCDPNSIMFSAKCRSILFSASFSDEVQREYENSLRLRSLGQMLAGLHPKYGKSSKMWQDFVCHPLFENGLIPEMLKFIGRPEE